MNNNIDINTNNNTVNKFSYIERIPLVMTTNLSNSGNIGNKRAETKKRTLQNTLDAKNRFERDRKIFSLGLGVDGEELSIAALSRVASMAAVFLQATGDRK